MNLPLGSTASSISIVGTNVTANRIVFGAGQGVQGVTLNGGGGAITLASTSAAIIANNSGTNTVGAVLNGTVGLRYGGSGTTVLTGTNGFTGGVTVSNGGTLQIGNGTSGSINSQNLTFNSGGGNFTLALASAGSQSLNALTFTVGHGTLTSQAASGSVTQTLTFASMAARAAGATGNLVLAGNTAAADNKIVLTNTANAPLDTDSNNPGLFFGGSEYARDDSVNGYFRAVNYGTDIMLRRPFRELTWAAPLPPRM